MRVRNAIRINVRRRQVISRHTTCARIMARTITFCVNFISSMSAVFIARFMRAFLLKVIANTSNVSVMSLPGLRVFLRRFFKSVIANVLIIFIVIRTFRRSELSICRRLLILSFRYARACFTTYHFGRVSIQTLRTSSRNVRIKHFNYPLRKFLSNLLNRFRFHLIATSLDEKLNCLLIILIRRTMAGSG